MAWTYILYSKDLDRYYIGQSDDIRSRIQHHVEGDTAFTGQASDWQMVFLQEHATRAEAMQLEREIKRKKSRRSIQRYLKDRRNLMPRPISITDW